MFGYLQITVPNLEAQVRYPEATNRKGVTLIFNIKCQRLKKGAKSFRGRVPTYLKG